MLPPSGLFTINQLTAKIQVYMHYIMACRPTRSAGWNGNFKYKTYLGGEIYSSEIHYTNIFFSYAQGDLEDYDQSVTS